jgi:CheY-like chemotaxis protein
MLTRHVLIADDDDGVRTMLDRVAVRTYPALSLRTFADGAAALRAFTERPADLVITDLRMPILSGVALIHALRALPSAVPILALSADAHAAGAALAAGANRFLAKPTTLASLRQILLELLPL